MVSQKQKEIKALVRTLQKNILGFQLMETDGREYLAINLKIPQRGGGALMTFIKQSISKSSLLLKSGSPAIATLLLLVGRELLDSIVKIAQEIADKQDTEESTTEIIKRVLKEKYATASVAIKKLLTYPVFQSIFIALAVKKLSDYDPTGASNRLLKKVDSVANTVVENVANSILTCPECQAVKPKSIPNQEYFKDASQLRRHRAHHKKTNYGTIKEEEY